METFKTNIERYFKDYKQNYTNCKKLLHDKEKHNYFITNSYSFIRLNYNNTKDKNKIDFLKNNYETEENGSLTKSIANYNNMCEENNFCNYLNIDKLEVITEKCYGKQFKRIKVNDKLYFDYKLLNHIKKVLGGSKFSYFTSEKDEKFLCITSKSGYAYLLACIKY